MHPIGAVKGWVDLAPAMGMIGTLIGLVLMLGNMGDPKSIGPAMAVALLTTLYEAFVANVMFAPMKESSSTTQILKWFIEKWYWKACEVLHEVSHPETFKIRWPPFYRLNYKPNSRLSHKL